MDTTTMIITISAIVGVVVVLVILVSVLARNYIKVPPNKAAVFYGKKGKQDGKVSGCYVISGGAKFKWPVLQNVDYINLDNFQMEVELQSIPNLNGVLVNVKGVATCKIMSDTVSLMAAVERFLGKRPEDITRIVKENLEGQLRAVIGKLTIEELIKDREKLNNMVKSEASEELSKIGVGIDILNIQSITDNDGYVQALGQKRTAEVKRDATVGRAEAERDAKINSTNAGRAGEVVAADNEAQVAAAAKDRDVKKAQYKALTDAEQATAAQAGPKSEAIAKQEVIKEQVKVDEARARAMIAVREQEIMVAEKEQEAKMVVPSRKKADAVEAEADGVRRAQIKEAEGQRTRLQLEGEGEGSKIRAIGEAEAARIKAVGLAEGEAIKAKLLAEAEGTLKKAEAYKALTQAGTTQMILEKLPAIVSSLAPVMGEIAKPMSNIDKVVIIDGGAGGQGVGKFVDNVPRTLFSLLQSTEAMGIDMKGLLEKIGIKMTDMMPVSTPVSLPPAALPEKTVVEAEAKEKTEKKEGKDIAVET